MRKRLVVIFTLLLFIFNLYTSLSQSIDEMNSQAQEYREKGDIGSEMQVLNKLAYAQWESMQYDGAAKSFGRMVEISTKLGNSNAILIATQNLGAVYYDAEKYQQSYDSYRQGAKLSKEMGRKSDLVSNLTNTATALQGLKKYDESNKTANEALEVAKELNDLKMLRTCYRILAENHESLGMTDKAIQYFDLFNTYDRKIKKIQMDQVKEESEIEVNKAQAEKRAKEIELKHTVDTLNEVKEITEMQRLEIDVLNKQKQIDELKKKELEKEIEYEKKIKRVFIGGFVIVLLLLLVIFYQFLQKRKANYLLEEQNNKINRQNKQITDSIHYAQTIQRAILPMQDTMKQSFDNFVIFRPKDIVSGDFYWYSCLEEGKKWIVAIIDCTGHGVPGAFMSMIGNTLLNSIINERKIYTPSKILQFLNEETVVALKQEKTDNKDGMDVCLCYLERKGRNEMKLVYAGAKRPLWYFDSQKKLVEEMKPDRLSIGGVKKFVDEIEFKDVENVLKSGDIIYLSTDGIIDQNAPDRKRFGSTRLISVLKEMATLPIEKQKNMLEKQLDGYMDGEEQRDDITFIGLKV